MEEHFWSLALETGWVQAAIWTIKEKEAHVVAVSNAVAWESDEDLLSACDTVLSSIVSGLAENAKEPSKTVFGVPPGWVGEGQIKKEYLDRIRNICHKLSLEPSGFVVLPEAIAHFKKSEENAPVSGVIVGVGTDALDITVVRLGTIIGTVNVGRSLSVLDDVVEGIARFGGAEPFPSRFLIYDGKSAELEDVRQELIKADWTGELKTKAKFLHTPQVEIVDPKMKMVAVSLAGASEIGQANVVTFDLGEEKAEKLKEEKPEIKVEQPKEDLSSHENLSEVAKATDFGFVMDQDINEVAGATNPNPVQTSANTPSFVTSPHPVSNPFPRNPISKIKHNIVRLPLILSGAWPLSAVKGKMDQRNKISMPGGEARKKMPIILAIAGAALLIFGFIGWWFLPKAEVTIFVSPKKIEQKQLITYDPKLTDPDISKRQLPISTVSTSVSGDKTKSTTGTLTIGDRAKGSVVIRNGGSDDIGLTAGTILTGPNSLKFSLDNGASVSAATSPSNPGTATISVTASGIGAEYNLAKGETLQVGNFSKSQVDALVDSDFSGGSSQEVVAVSKDDLSVLQKDLTSELTEKAQNQLKEKLGDDEILLDPATIATASGITYDHVAGDQASTLKLSENLSLTSYVVSKKNLGNLARDIVKGQVPNGFVVKDDQISTNFDTKLGLVDGVWKLDTTFNVNLLPQINTDDIAKKIAGKSQKAAQEILSRIAGYVRAEIHLTKGFPSFGTLPHVVKNISVELSSEK
ncbi:MAG TPA: hypothetical protein VF185_01235 [Patescibacteria group bacterium]